ncbi:MAG TPA: N-acetyl-gamma-glutamyl-phosphate reductase [Terriglobia bacterium]|nr:N-acetyl-gamma-glutamyl-phosphate reductase [Terriglobia bacterium]
MRQGLSGKLKVALIGATGYSGAEIIRILLRHPAVELDTLMTANVDRKETQPQRLSTELPQFYGLCNLEIEPLNLDALQQRNVATVILATPNETSHELVPSLVERDFRVIDLSGSFRLQDKSLYLKWYGFEHQHPRLLEASVYGLTEINRDAIRNARLLANPGCYPTSALLPLIPLQRQNLLDSDAGIICDSKSGVSGAGKSPTANTHFSEVTESFKAYNVLRHRHTPEIWQGLGHSQLIFIPHLLPINRGILTTLYARVRPSVTEEMVKECFGHTYGRDPLIRLFANEGLPEIKFVAHTNYCDIGWKLDGMHNTLIVICAIDNLGKGAAGQAVQNMNLMLGLEETAGLL